jgi:hypothetical protein
MEQERTFAESMSETPYQLRYSDILRVGTPVATMNYHKLIPSNGAVFGNLQTIRLPFNTPTDSFANLKGAFIKLRVNNTGSNTFRLDPCCGVGALISTWRIVSGTGALIEEIVNYNAINAVMADLVGEQHRTGHMALNEGCSNNKNINSGSGANQYDSPNIGGTASVSGGAVKIANTNSKTFTHIPMSGFFQADRLCPIGFSNGTAYVEIVLPSLNFPFAVEDDSHTSIGWSVDNVELHVPVLRMGNEFNQSFRELLASGVPINWNSQSYQNIQSNIANGSTGENTIILSTRKRSVKSLITILRLTSTLTHLEADSASARVGCACSEYNYEVGGTQIPNNKIKVSAEGASGGNGVNGADIGESFSHLVNCLANLGNVYTGTMMVRQNYLKADNSSSSRIAFGVDLETYGHSDVQSGMNLSGQGLPIVFRPTLGVVGGAVNVDCYALHDVVYTLDGISGTITSSS